MIGHVYHDGSMGEEHEIGDRVKVNEPIYDGFPYESLYPAGMVGTVVYVEHFRRERPSYHTASVMVKLEKGPHIKHLMCKFDSMEEPRLKVIEKED